MTSPASKWKKAAGVVKATNSAVASFKEVPHGIDARTFFVKIPQQVRDVIPIIHEISQNDFRATLGGVVDYCCGAEFTDETFISLQATTSIKGNIFSQVFTAIFLIVRAIIQNRTVTSIVEKDLKEMNFPTTHLADLILAMKKKRNVLEDAAVENRTRFPKMDNLTWRVDVAISTSNVSRVMRPSVMMQMTLSDGSIKTFEVSPEQFSDLRYNVAKLLRTMKELENHPIMAIKFEADKRKFDEEGKANIKYDANTAKGMVGKDVNMRLRT